MKQKKRILVTGAAGYIARVFIFKLAKKEWADIIGMDVQVPSNPVRGVRYIQADMLSQTWADLVEAQRPDVLVHLAFVVNPMRDEAKMREINVRGTQNTFDAAQKAGVKHILCASSATAYGALPDNPVPLKETDPIRGHLTDYRYARDKARLEQICDSFAKQNPSCKVSIIRPVIVFGPNVENFLSRFVYAFPVVPLLNCGMPPIQFVHEQDVAEIMLRIVELEKAGAFNVAGLDWLTFEDVCRMAKRLTIGVPPSVLRVAINAIWKMGIKRLEAPGPIVDYIQYPWVVSMDKVKKELGYEMQFSSVEAVMDMVKSRST